jgi:hypothetical protein
MSGEYKLSFLPVLLLIVLRLCCIVIPSEGFYFGFGEEDFVELGHSAQCSSIILNSAFFEPG